VEAQGGLNQKKYATEGEPGGWSAYKVQRKKNLVEKTTTAFEKRNTT